jgi:glycosyltransferase involved in cell wall biosynthesis
VHDIVNPSANADVTAVISCFNYGEFLLEAIRSLTTQEGGPPRHVIVVDDGSTDPGTQRCLDELGDEARVIRQENQGASAARNTGLRLVDTPYAIVLDADDRLVPDALGVLRAALESHPRIGYAYGYMRFFGARSGVMKMPAFDPWRLMFRHIVGPTALMRTEMVRATGGYDPNFPHYEDWEIWVHALRLGWHGLCVDRTILEQRKHGVSKMDADRANYRQYFGLIREKHAALYGDLGRIARTSSAGLGERLLYRYVWALRPWPARFEHALYSLLWRR